MDTNAYTIVLMISNEKMLNALAVHSQRYNRAATPSQVAASRYQWDDEIKRDNYINFSGANVYKIKGGLWRICGHHPGEAYESYKILTA